MRAVFKNRLSLDRTAQKKHVFFKHGYDAPIKTWFEKSTQNPYGWVMQFECASDGILKEFKEDIFKRGIQYIEKRLDKPIKDVSFQDIVEMADVLEIKSAG